MVKKEETEKDTTQERIQLLEENEKKLRTDLITLENHKKQTEQNLFATLGGLSELRLIKESKK